MSRGRCAGCGYEDASCKKVRTHVNTCPEFLVLYKTEPARAIDPEDEFVRFKALTETFEYQEARDEEKSAKHAKYREDAERKLAVSKDRFAGGTRTRFRSAASQESVTSPPEGVPVPAFDDSATGRVLAAAFRGEL